MTQGQKVCSIVLRPYCSNSCIFCRPLEENSRLPASALDQLDRDAFDAIEEFAREGYRGIDVSGGDPLEYRKIFLVLKTLRDKGFRWIRISTNGVKLADASFVDALRQHRVDEFRIPLYGANAKRHDSITRAEGSFALTVRGIKNIKKKMPDSRILLTCLLLKQNAPFLNAIFDFMHELGCDDLHFRSPHINSNEPHRYYIPYKWQRPFYLNLIQHAKRVRRPLRLVDVPFCVLGFANDFTDNREEPAHLGSRFQPPGAQRTNKLNWPAYRLKVKLPMCKKCSASDKCTGFMKNDIARYGAGDLAPV